MKLNIIVVTSTLIALIVTAPAKALAQSAGLSISPPTVEILLSPQKKIIQSFTVKNQGESGQFVAQIHKFKPNGNQGQVLVDPNSLDLSQIPLKLETADQHLTLGEPFTIGKGAATQITLSLEGSVTDVAQDSYLALVVQPFIDGSPTTSTVPGIAGLLLVTLTPSPNLPVDLSVDNFELPLVWDSSSTLSFSPVVKNNSPIMIRPLGSLNVLPFHRSPTELPLYPNLVLGNSSRELVEDCDNSPCELAYRPAWYGVGPYRFRLTLTTQGGTKLTEVERTVWLFPFKICTIVIVVFLLVAGFLLYRKRHQ